MFNTFTRSASSDNDACVPGTKVDICLPIDGRSVHFADEMGRARVVGEGRTGWRKGLATAISAVCVCKTKSLSTRESRVVAQQTTS